MSNLNAFYYPGSRKLTDQVWINWLLIQLNVITAAVSWECAQPDLVILLCVCVALFVISAASAELITTECHSCLCYVTLLKLVDHCSCSFKDCVSHFIMLPLFLLPQTTIRLPSTTITVPPPSPYVPAPEPSLAAPFPLCLRPANQCPTFSLRCPTPARLLRRWWRRVSRAPSRPAGRGLAAVAASARLSASSTGTRSRSSALPVLEGERLPGSRRTAAKNPPTAGSRSACPFRGRFSLWYVEKVMLVLSDTATKVPLVITRWVV